MIVSSRGRIDERVLNSYGERPLFVVHLQVIAFAQISLHDARQRLVGHEFGRSTQILDFQLRFCGQRSGLSAFDEPLVDAPHDVGTGVSNVIVDFGKIGNHVWRPATGGHDVMNAGEVGRVFTQ